MNTNELKRRRTRGKSVRKRRSERGNAAVGCLVIIAGVLVLLMAMGSCIGGNPNDDGDDSNDCYYSDPIPHWDECY